MKTVSFSYPSTRISFTASAFMLPGADANAILLFEDGLISGWNPVVDPTQAIIAVNKSHPTLQSVPRITPLR